MNATKLLDQAPLTGSDLRPGMKVHKVGEPPKTAHTIGKYSGECEKGRHFGAACYDRLGRWWTL